MGIEMSRIEKVKRPAKSVDAASKSTNTFDINLSFGTRLLKDTKKEEFYSEVFLLLQSGLDLKRSIEIFTNQQTVANVKNIFSGIEEKLVKGISFSEALQQYLDFSAYEYYSIKIGEESGQLLEILSELGNFYQRKMKQQKQLVSAFTYPTVILMTAIIAVGFMMNFIVPMFADAFKRFNSDLPGLTQFIVNLSADFIQYWWLMLIILAGTGLAIYSLQKIREVRVWISERIIHIPLFGILLQKIYLARFCQSMALMVTARTPLIVSLDLVGKMVGYLPLERALKEVSREIYKGKMLNEAMDSKPLFDQRMVSLIKVGEETNKLDIIFKKLYEQYSGEADHRTTMMNALLEPILIVVVGVLVAVILIAMYLPMFKIGNSMI
jgi:type IV pilus assembly protein PilC